MTLVERFIEFQRWPTSRKTALLMGIALPAQIFGSVAVAFWARRAAVVRMDLVEQAFLAGILIVAFCFAVAAFASWRKWEARWTAYLVVLLYGGWIGFCIILFGAWSTAFFAWPPIVVILVALWFDERLGWFAFAVHLIFYATVVVATLTDHLPYAPAMIERTLEAQRSLPWIATVLCAFIAFYLYGFLLSVVVVSARKLQAERLRTAHEQLDRSARLIRRYIPSQLAQQIIAGEHTDTARPERARLTIFFSDLVGFADIAEELEPEDLAHVLNEYFSRMTEIADRHGGTVDELTGDAILVFFGAPNVKNHKDHATSAARMALDMQRAMGDLNAKWREAGITEVLRARMGINTGLVTVGNFGSPERMKYAVLGKHVNLAARLQAQCEPGRVLVSQATWLLISDQVKCVEKGELQLKGFHKPVMAYELRDPSPGSG